MPHTGGFLEDGIQLEEIQKKYSSEQDLFLEGARGICWTVAIFFDINIW